MLSTCLVFTLSLTIRIGLCYTKYARTVVYALVSAGAPNNLI